MDNEEETLALIQSIHVLGVPKLYKRAARDLSKLTLEQMGISHHLAKQAINSMHYGEIKDHNHYENLVAYIQRKKVIYENANINWIPQGNRVLDAIKRMKAPNKFSQEDMAHFRRMYPEPNAWHGDVIKLKLAKSYMDQLEQMEAQRYDEDCKKPLVDSDYAKLAPFKAYLELLHRNIRIKVDGHETNSGWCLVLCGKAATYKTTANLIMAQSYGPYHVNTGHQYIERDVLKYDDAARAQIEQLIIEEMAWTSLPHKKTLEDTLCSIKEQLSGAGLNIRLAKNKSSLEGLKMKIKRFFMSYNPDNIIDFETLNKKINSKMEFKRRFYILDFDSLEYANVFAKPKGKWTEDLIPLAAKCIATSEAWRKFNDYLEGIKEIGEFNFEDTNRDLVLGIKREFTEQEELEAQDELKRRIHHEMANGPLADEPEEQDPDIIWIECPEESETEEI
ncbi:hypothetical protein BpHYR1_018376 [Brachionus plicatilis]|uniref:Uncharacterized protein n=1 Tax=Brachionus plicatilis TaxID=10195 RepID=A0A3M7PM83_BRAPC|nr:hypothetical protein BpHYR1_018376 [Brachionus plicatilis]